MFRRRLRLRVMSSFFVWQMSAFALSFSEHLCLRNMAFERICLKSLIP